MARPIPSIIAKIIYKLEKFNSVILDNNLSKLSDINLVNRYSYARTHGQSYLIQLMVTY